MFCAKFSATSAREIHWKPLFNALLEDELKNLRTLNVFIAAHLMKEAEAVLEMLSGCEAMAKLSRCRPGLVLNVRGKHHRTFSGLCLSVLISPTF